MNDLRVPGVLWVVLLVFGLAALRNYVPEPFYVELGVVFLLAIMKYFNLGTKEIDELLEIINMLRPRLQEGDAMRSMAFAEAVVEKHEPNKLVRWLLG